MKTIALTLLAAALAFAQNTSTTTTTPAKKTADQKKSQKATAPKPPAKAEPPVQTIPTGAKQVGPNLYRYTDSNGKTWNYRQTPFGINRWEQTSTPGPEPAPQPAAPAAPPSTPSVFQTAHVKTEPINVTDQGDSYRFDKNTPFGHSTWVRKKSEVTDEEKAAIAAQQAQSGPDSAGTAKTAGN